MRRGLLGLLLAVTSSLALVAPAAGLLAATLVAGFVVLGADGGGDRAPAVGKVDPTACRAQDGRVLGPAGQTASYGELADAASRLSVLTTS